MVQIIALFIVVIMLTVVCSIDAKTLHNYQFTTMIGTTCLTFQATSIKMITKYTIKSIVSRPSIIDKISEIEKNYTI